MSTDEPKKPLSIEEVAECLSLSNEEGTSWYGFDLAEDRKTIVVTEWGDEGEVVAHHRMWVEFERIEEEA